MTNSTAVMPQSRGAFDRLAGGIQTHWLAALNIILGIWVFTPFLAPVFMKLGLYTPAQGIYLFYSTQCHQFPQRSYFLFGEQLTYALPEINAARGTENMSPLSLRQFIGNEQMGYKVAWSDRMISLYTSFFFGSFVYAALRLPPPLGGKPPPNNGGLPSEGWSRGWVSGCAAWPYCRLCCCSCQLPRMECRTS